MDEIDLLIQQAEAQKKQKPNLPATDNIDDLIAQVESGGFTSAPAESTRIDTAQDKPESGGLMGMFSNIGQNIARQNQAFGERFAKRGERVLAPTELGNVASEAVGGGTVGKVAEAVAGAPERLVRAAAIPVGTAGDIVGTGVATGAMTLNDLLGGLPGKGIKGVAGLASKIPGAKDAGGTLLDMLTKATEWYENLPPEDKANLGAAVDLTEAFGLVPAKAGAKQAAKAAVGLPKATDKVLSLPGEALESVGKSAMRGGLKIKDVTARKAAKNIEQGAKKIVDDIAKYKVQSTTGGFKGISKNAAKEIEKAKSIADNIITKSKIDPNKTVDIDGVFLQFMDDLEKGAVDAVGIDEIDNAIKHADNIYEALNKYAGISGSVPIDVANEAKKAIGRGAFKKGAPNIADDPVKNKVKELLNLRIRDAIETHVPEIRQQNQKIHDLINVRLAADEAAKRMQNWNMLTMTDLILGGAGGGAAAISKSPETALGTAALMLTNRILRGGKGASAAISAGQALKSPIGKAGAAGKAAMNLVGIGKKPSVPPQNLDELIQGLPKTTNRPRTNTEIAEEAIRRTKDK